MCARGKLYIYKYQIARILLTRNYYYIFPRSASGAVAAANLISQIQQGKIKLNQGLKLSKAGNLYLYLGNSQFTDASEEQRVISRWHMQSY